MSLRLSSRPPLRLQSLLFALLATGHAHAMQTDIGSTLPDLPQPHRASDVTRFKADPGGFTLGYDAPDQGWGAIASRPTGTETALQLTYGSILAESLAAGIHLAIQPRQSEVVLNGVYDPVNDLRLHMAVGQLRTSTTYQFVFGEYASNVAQNSYLLDVRKYWQPGSLLRDFGASVFQAGAREHGAEQALLADRRTERLATGKQQGYMLNLSLAPSDYSTLELGQGVDRAEYGMADGAESTSGTAVRQASFTQYLDNCTRVRGGVRSSASTDEVQLDLHRGSWQVGLSRHTNRDGGESATAVTMGYTIALGETRRSAQKCRSKPRNVASFSPIFKAATARPATLPSGSLVQVDTTVPAATETNPLADAEVTDAAVNSAIPVKP